MMEHDGRTDEPQSAQVAWGQCREASYAVGATAGGSGCFDLRREPDVGFLLRGTLALLASDPEEHDVAILDPVLAPFNAQLARGTKRLHRTRCDELVD